MERERASGKAEFTPTPEQKTRMTEAMGKLEKSLDAIYDDATFRSWLDVQSRFRNYSATNTAMILAQKPDATRVMGLRQWSQLQRFVNKGERGLHIFAPIFPKGMTKDEQQKSSPVAYIPVKTYEYSQTNGKPLPGYCQVNFQSIGRVGRSVRLRAQNGFNMLANGAKTAVKWELVTYTCANNG